MGVIKMKNEKELKEWLGYVVEYVKLLETTNMGV